MPEHGKLTADLARQIAKGLASKGYEVLHDHGDEKDNGGQIVAWYGKGKTPERVNKMSEIDIAIVKAGTAEVSALIEVEEKKSRPKDLLGDVFAVLAGDHVSFKDRLLKVGPSTTLIVMARGKPQGEPRRKYVMQSIQAARAYALGANKTIGAIRIELFAEDADLHQRGKDLVQNLIDTGKA